MNGSEAPIQLRHHFVTREGPLPPRPEDFGKRIPFASDRPAGLSPQAVRVFRRGEHPITLRLLTTQTYQIGRGLGCQLLFSDTTVSRLHGVLYFVPELSAWAFRDPFSTLGSCFYRAAAQDERTQVKHDTPVGVVAGQVLELGYPENRIEFLDAIPSEVVGAGPGRWRSKAARKLEDSVRDGARKSRPVLLFGPSGSGKTYLAQRIHELSGRRGSYIELNCGRLPRDPNQLQSELLGHVKGAYTGATHRRTGALFEADHGTLFLDEVESLPAEAQVFLLDVLEGKSHLRPLGSDKGLPRPNVRFVFSTKVPLDRTPLREDLVNRLVLGHRIIIPTLAERRDDIPILVANILDIIRAEVGIEATVTEEAMEFLMAQPWPGQVRQLKDALYSTTDGNHVTPVELRTDAFEEYLRAEDLVRGRNGRPSPDEELVVLPPGIPTSPVEVTRKRPVDLTREDLLTAIQAGGGIMKRAAELLGCSPTTLREKRKDLGV
jgi:DNA-binding NtrC family response regulator